MADEDVLTNFGADAGEQEAEPDFDTSVAHLPMLPTYTAMGRKP